MGIGKELRICCFPRELQAKRNGFQEIEDDWNYDETVDHADDDD